MKKAFLKSNAFLLAIIFVLTSFPIFVSVSADDSFSLEYEFIGDEAKLAGFAQGLITITPNESAAKSGYYVVYYTDGTNLLSGFDELASAPITGNPVRIEIKDGTFIPQGAKGIAVFEHTSNYYETAPSISQAKAKCAIPASKRLTLSGEELVFGLASDVHMNYQGTGAGAYKKWENALKFYNQHGATHIVVSGDMTGDSSDTSMGEEYSLENQYKKYMSLVTAAGFTKETAIECLGNHSNTTADRGLFTTYAVGSNAVQPYAGSSYYYVLLDGKNGAKDNLFIILQQELDGAESGYKANQSANVDNFSQAQMDWFEGLMKQYGNDANTNVFVLCHSPFRNYGAGEKYNGGYSSVLTFKDEYPQNMRFKHLLETYKNVTVFSGHTHQSLYDALNYSDMGNTFANTVHVPSTAAPRAYKDGVNTAWYDTHKGTNDTYGSETYIVKVYADYVVYMGYNLATNKYIPAGCLIVPTKRSATPNPNDVFEGLGTATDPYLIQNEGDFLALTNGMNSATTEANKYGDGKYFKQTADINMAGIESYFGTHANGGVYANGDARCYFGGHYDGNGYEIKVTIHGPDQRSVFPYCYGNLTNIVIRGDIVSEYAAQPVRANRGNLVNCVFDCYLDAYMVSGVTYSNYSNVYNVYTTGMMNGTSTHPVASNATSTNVKNLYHHYIGVNGTEITSDIGTRSNNYQTIASAFNLRSGSDYNTAASNISPVVMSKAGVVLGTLKLGHDGNLPVIENIPTSGNVAKYSKYTLSQLYRQGGAESDWGWDETAKITYPDETGASLTDGVFATQAKYGDTAWIGFHSKAPEYIEKGYHSIKFEFDVVANIETINIYVATIDIGNGIDAPDSIDVYCDGVKVTSVTPTNVSTNADTATEKVVIPLEKSAKTFELRMKNYAWVFVSEVELMSYVPEVHVCSPDGNGYKSDKNNHWELCSCGEKLNSSSHDDGKWFVTKTAEVGVEGEKELRCTVCDYLIKTEKIPAISENHKHSSAGDWVSDGASHWHYCSCGEIMDKADHISGDWVTTKEPQVGVDGEKTKYCIICRSITETDSIPALEEPVKDDYILGDVNASGAIDMMDYILLKRNYFGTFKFDETQLKAGDVNHSGAIDMMDYILLKRAYFGTFTLV